MSIPLQGQCNAGGPRELGKSARRSEFEEGERRPLMRAHMHPAPGGPGEGEEDVGQDTSVHFGRGRNLASELWSAEPLATV